MISRKPWQRIQVGLSGAGLLCITLACSFPLFGAVHVNVAEDGTIEEATATGGDPLLRKAAVEAVRQWRYQPARKQRVKTSGNACDFYSCALPKFNPCKTG
jgi:hypothetical protein